MRAARYGSASLSSRHAPIFLTFRLIIAWSMPDASPMLLTACSIGTDSGRILRALFVSTEISGTTTTIWNGGGLILRTVLVRRSDTTVNPPYRAADTLSKCLEPATSSSPIAAASSTSSLFLTPRRVAMASAPPVDEAALLPSPLPGFIPFLMVIEKPMRSYPHSSESFMAA